MFGESGEGSGGSVWAGFSTVGALAEGVVAGHFAGAAGVSGGVAGTGFGGSCFCFEELPNTLPKNLAIADFLGGI
jgi:hypothetical protein